MIPLDIQAMGLFYPIVDYKKKYNDDTLNESKGEIEKHNYGNPSRNDLNIGQHCTGTRKDENNIEYYQWVHLGRDYFKTISKIRGSGWTCQ